jgi:hypothetical protein
MPLDVTIKDTIKKFVEDEKMFTSVDISNDIKKRGIWVRNVEVTHWLKKNFSTNKLFDTFTKSQISVCQNLNLAFLYHPIWSNPNDYKDRDQKPLTPVEVSRIKKDLKDQLRDDTTPDIKDIFDEPEDSQDDDDEEFIIHSVERLKIPGALIQKLGWKPGDTIDPALIQTPRTIPSHLKVNKDYRVSIPRSAVDWGTNPVKLKIKNGRIIFEKA